VRIEGSAAAPVVAVQDGRVVALGRSPKLGNYLAIEDADGDVFSYAGLASVASTYRLAGDAPAGSGSVPTTTQAAAQTAGAAAPKQPASAGSQPPVTLAPGAASAASTELAPSTSEEESAAESPALGKVVMFAHPGNPDAKIAAARLALRSSRTRYPKGTGPLRVGAVVSQGTTLGTLARSANKHAGYLRFAIRPAGDTSAVDPQAIVQNWIQLQRALHPKGAAADAGLVGATADDVFLMSAAELQRAVLADPSIVLPACARASIRAGSVDSRVLSSLLFLARNGLAPTVSAIRCSRQAGVSTAAHTAVATGDGVDISAINGVRIAGHQGAGSITDLTIRTLLTLPGGFSPASIASLMRYPGSAITHAAADHAGYIGIGFAAAGKAGGGHGVQAVSSAAHSAGPGATAPSPFLVGSGVSSTGGGASLLSSGDWNGLLTRIGGLQQPKVPGKPTSAAIRDRSSKPKR
jgi:hypothetical protein